MVCTKSDQLFGCDFHAILDRIEAYRVHITQKIKPEMDRLR